jgi:TRAP-type C4-dicarboxylate transport system substrate-binding protein
MYPTNHVWSSNVVSVNLDAWNKLSAANRDAIEGVAKRLQPQFWDVSKAEDSKKVKILTDNGVIYGEVTASMLKDMQEQTAPMLAETIESIGGPAAEIIDAYKKELGN